MSHVCLHVLNRSDTYDIFQKIAVANLCNIFVLAIVGTKGAEKYNDLANWSYAIGYGVGSGSPLSPSFNFCLELAKGSEVCRNLKFLF